MDCLKRKSFYGLGFAEPCVAINGGTGWIPLNGMTFLLRGDHVRTCDLPSSREDGDGRLYLSFSEASDIAAGDLLVALSAQQAWRVVGVQQETIGGVVMQKRIFYREASMGHTDFGLSLARAQPGG